MKKGTKTGKWKWLNLKLLVKIFAASRKQLKKNVLKFSDTHDLFPHCRPAPIES